MSEEIRVSIISYIKAFFIKIRLMVGKRAMTLAFRFIVAFPIGIIILGLIANADRLTKSERQRVEQVQTTHTPPTNTPQTNIQQTPQVTKPPEEVPREKKEQVFNEHIDRAVQLANDGKYESALEEVEKAIDIGINNAIAYHLRGLIKSHMGLLEEAAEDLKKACNLKNNDACRDLQSITEGTR